MKHLTALIFLFISSLAFAQNKVLVIIADDIAFDDLDPSLPIPHIQSLASGGIYFPNAYSNPTCSPSRVSLFFSKWRTRDAGVCGPPNQNTIPIDLPSIGTEASPCYLIGKAHIGADPVGGSYLNGPQSHGIAWPVGIPANVAMQSVGCLGTGYNSWEEVINGVSSINTSYNPIVMRDAVLNFLPNWTCGVLVYSSNLAHGPFHTPDQSLLPPNYPPVLFTQRQRFEGMIVALDTIIGQILANIDLNTTYVIFVGDNGTPEQVAPNPNKAKGTTFQRGIRVPLSIMGPGISPGQVNWKLCHLVDILPTICEILEKPIPSGIEGISLLDSSAHKYIFCGVENSDPNKTDLCAKSNQYKYRRFGANLTEEFYDLYADPSETVNLINDPTLQSKIDKYRVWMNANLP